MYQYRQSGDTYVVSIDNHEEIVASLAQFCMEQGILSGRIDGIGAVNSATLRFLDPVTKKYVDRTFDEQMEIAALVGNISEKDGKVYLHLHATFGRRDYTAVAGHLLCSRVCKRTVTAHTQFQICAVVTYHIYLGGSQLIAILLIHPTLHRLDNLRVIETVDMVIASRIASV